MNVAAFITDARGPDPTGTAGLRRSFRAAGKLRLRMFRAAMRLAVVEHDVLGLGGGGLALQLPETRLRAFQGWAQVAAEQQLGGPWLSEWVARAWASGEAVGALQTRSEAPGEGSGAWAELARIELQAIQAAVIQALTREAAVALTKRRANKVMTWRRMAKAFNKVGPRRIMALANTFTVCCHNRGRLAAYRAAGVTKVGVVPEQLLPKHESVWRGLEQTRAAFQGRSPLPDHALPGPAAPRPTKPYLAAPGTEDSSAITRGSAKSSLDAKHKGYRELGPARPEYELGEVEEPIEVGVRTAGDEFVCIECDAFAANSPHDIDDVEDELPLHPNCRCLMPGTMVEGEVLAASKSWYAGCAVELVTTRGKRLSLTVNHPVLTARGWCPAGQVREGDQLVGYRDEVGSAAVEHEDHGPARIEDVFEALLSGGVVKVAPSALDFHGDGKSIEGQVHVVFSDARLLRDFETSCADRLGNIALGLADPASGVEVGGGDLLGLGSLTHAAPLDTLLVGRRAEFDAVFRQNARDDVASDAMLGGDDVEGVAALVSSRDGALRELAELDELCGGLVGAPALDGGHWHPGVTDLDALGHRAQGHASVEQQAFDAPVVSAVFPFQLMGVQSGEIILDEVLHVHGFSYRGHVYDLQTATGYIVAEGLATKNCTWFPWDDQRFSHDTAIEDTKRKPTERDLLLEKLGRKRHRLLAQLAPRKFKNRYLTKDDQPAPEHEGESGGDLKHEEES